MAAPQLSLGIDDLARYVFVQHEGKQRIDLEVTSGIENNKHMFCFCMDLLCKGLILMFGGGATSLEVNGIQMDQFQQVNDKLHLMGINCTLTIVPLEQPLSPPEVMETLQKFHDAPDTLRLEDYVFQLIANDSRYEIRFNLFHNTVSDRCNV